ncbi:unnamed protein product [Aphanomyces euteiches]|uniref:Uncharacterized protein n=1 Tax=Aphanomyces euteiches TaxID=100861 RepID=A0A6G0XCI5_9STRA|nr:hypothetical protein Ae201684_006214 [Aphanomyces euteiches]KAH9069051.1 hypothetical protein Ae201684P_004747 [Aphanomyces euteiches]KAH9096883.1 hypothetical protein LEN26_017224 [Aphanomyces euteiches]KAH9128535.1 hypothetical protein AeMF1_001322 [Aphanomyces euteiches]KAH9145867.1 hypothetical protein AeRB84_010261 [Aphanomyces euteiches]
MPCEGSLSNEQLVAELSKCMADVRSLQNELAHVKQIAAHEIVKREHLQEQFDLLLETTSTASSTGTSSSCITLPMPTTTSRTIGIVQKSDWIAQILQDSDDKDDDSEDAEDSTNWNYLLSALGTLSWILGGT